MSTKIYEGLRYVGKRGMSGLLKELKDLRVKHVELSIEHLMKVLKPEARADWDDLRRLLDWATHEDMRRGNPLDLSCSVVVIPIRWKGKEEILINPFGHAVKLLARKRNFKEFGYYNNTDKPDKLTDKEWDEREAMWELATNSNAGGAWNQCGFVFEADAESTLLEITWKVVKKTFEENPEKKPDKLYKKRRGMKWGLYKPPKCDNDVCTHRLTCALSIRCSKKKDPSEGEPWWPELSGQKTKSGKNTVFEIKCLSLKREKTPRKKVPNESARKRKGNTDGSGKRKHNSAGRLGKTQVRSKGSGAG